MSAPAHVLAPNPGPLTLEGTNTWIISGPQGTIVVDPGPADTAHLTRIAEYGPVVSVLLTHAHRDHSAAITELLRPVVVYAASELATSVQTRLEVDADLIVAGVPVRVIITPGHTSDSVCFAVPVLLPDGNCTTAVFTGDTLLGGNKASLITGDGGRLADYLVSLERLSSMERAVGYPGHGPQIADLGAYAHQALTYRLSRLERLMELLRRGCAADPASLAQAMYPDLPERHELATRMIAPELEYLTATRRA